ncbi:MAG: hypothetical protein HBSAPP02_27990 [Phycisphaerae bacterium]|nr:MAG: hypothetical protein HRU71_01100 [Planctomycetia bacterium]GJQ27767.1 MAG: hypothetical protein HBSAPP02_27990 [Phycisphaerae bacterium]
MIRRILGMCLVCCFGLGLCIGCSENEHKVTEKKEIKTEGEVKDVSPGEMVVE